jgi:hypothetical protein
LTLNSSRFRPRIGLVPPFSDAELRALAMLVPLLLGARDAQRDANRISSRMRSLVPPA